MKIAIIGGGSLGLLFAHYLSKLNDVHLYVRTNEQKNKLLTEGLLFEKNGQIMHNFIQSSLFTEWKGSEDLTIIAVKQYHLQNVLKQMVQSAPFYHGSLLFIQNGMGHLKWLDIMQTANIYIGSVEHGANKIHNNHVIHTGKGITKLANYKSNSQFILKELVQFTAEDFPFMIEQDYEEMLVKKLVVNAVINPLTAVLNAQNGELVSNPHFYKIFKQLFAEISLTLKLNEKAETLSHIENVCKKTATNRSSMLQDLDGNRPTEVDAILGYILEKADELGMHIPLAASFYEAIKGKEYKGRREM
ncbi:2-dehydropantoate 2-reductase [Cytobacillus depressus]|uniref:2-dehydropantoate 2-reductase n=1 Tax=Cytobacillus depressus TaxID=1602942 RepID=A0A6L3V7J2_9BACI|nr:2-dehydropantoate 2-reductase [Cytobacillus depressus]KAB2337407.1 2-dehydropantoate 2-reductase [Cytobacillus depressus]